MKLHLHFITETIIVAPGSDKYNSRTKTLLQLSSFYFLPIILILQQVLVFTNILVPTRFINLIIIFFELQDLNLFSVEHSRRITLHQFHLNFVHIHNPFIALIHNMIVSQIHKFNFIVNTTLLINRL
ncbi:hypothetical protein V8G54_014914 [Vigna mungo]|uniref:Uncharacterized protein n=1 Tax=Vigna mungo TaxID=3915 RepID=A0AAQ3RZX4_VIGMU